MKRQNTVMLLTPWSDQPEIPWNEYPRPQLRRDSFLCLNGKWNLHCNGESWGEILVPYPPEAPLSGIARAVGETDVLVYERSFTLPADFNRGRILLHFGAVDQICEVWVNGAPVGSHEGGYLPFFFDITDHLQSENSIRVEVRDPLDQDYPWGKQCRKRGGMWYTPVSGIWQTVWLESVPEHSIEALTIDTDMESVTITVHGSAGSCPLRRRGR